MSFDPIERSNYDGTPTELYEFSLGSSTWRYAGGQHDISFGGATYSAVAIAHEGFSQSGNPETDDLTISLSASAEVTALFIGMPPSDAISLVVRTLHRGDTEAPVVWSGTVKSAKQVSDAEWTLSCNSLLATLNRNGLRLSWGRGCPHALYDRLCTVDPAAYATTLQIASLTSTTITSPAIESLAYEPPFDSMWPQYLAGGYLSFTGPHGATERLGIEGHSGDTITMLGITEGLSAGDWITVYPGCNRTTVVCNAKFENLANYGGFPHLPSKSPFDGDPVF